MKTLVGVDIAGRYKAALQVLGALGFSNNELGLVSVVEPIQAYAADMAPGTFVAPEWVKELQACAEQELHEASSLACDYGLKNNTQVLNGPAAGMLLEYADTQGVDLVAVGASSHSPLAAAMFGSVSRALAIASYQTLLVVKSPWHVKRGPLTAVFATDHSAYADQCLEQLIEWAPKGLGTVHVLTAFEVNEDAVKSFARTMPHADMHIDQWIEKQVEAACRKDVEKLRKAGYKAHALAAQGTAEEVIRTEMAATKADILILGAQGHGFMERLFMGSVALNFVLNALQPVLVLRAPART